MSPSTATGPSRAAESGEVLAPRPRTVYAYTDSDDFGGAEQGLAILLSGLVDRGWRPTLLHGGAPGIAPLVRQVASRGVPDRIVRPMPEGLRGAARALGLRRLLMDERPDIFHAHLTWPFSAKWALAAACAARLCAVVGTAQLYVDVPMGLSRRLQVRALGRRVDRIIAVSEDTRRRFGGLGWPLERIAVVHNSVDLSRFAAALDPAVRRSLDDGSGRPIALVPARLHPQKGHRHLLEAAVGLPGVRFVCVGDGELREALVRDAERLGVSDRVAFLGFREDMPALLRSCDLVVLPSLYEGLPLSLIEAMAAGRMVVATDIGGTRELVTHGETGILVPPGDPGALREAITAALGGGAPAAGLAAAGRDRAVTRFASGAMVDAVCDVYESVLSDRRGG